ncbi:MAG: electron transport complex subunit RsxB [Pseudomonas sp.]
MNSISTPLAHTQLIQHIDALLPQTQCGKCGHPGCKPYAQGIAAGEALNKCPPGGAETIAALASLMNLPVLPLELERGSAPAQVAYIREAECIGCTKCIQACPVDAILGAAKLMHTVLIDECTGCDLCVAPCPVDCIEMHPLPTRLIAPAVVPLVGDLAGSVVQQRARAARRNLARERFEQRAARLLREDAQKAAERQAHAQRTTQARDATRTAVDTHTNTQTASNARDPAQSAIARVKAQQAARALSNAHGTPATLHGSQSIRDDTALKKSRIDAAMTRAQLNKARKAFGYPPTAAQHAQLAQLYQALEQAERRLAAGQDTYASR